MPRPGHADLTAALKWDDCQDPRGSGHFSGRLTLPVVAAGVVAKKILQDATMLDDTPVNEVNAQIVELGGQRIATGEALAMTCNGDIPDEWKKTIEDAMQEGDSVGAVIECTVPDIDPGYGEPFWDSVESLIAHAVFAIPGVRGIEFGDGFMASKMRGSEHNDPIGPDGRPTKNGAGGVNGGITNGAPIKFRVAFKPTSSIRKAQQTFNFVTGEMDTLQVPGRHDVCFALRAPVVVEAMTAIVLADLVQLK
jgi:chorismate synthase